MTAKITDAIRRALEQSNGSPTPIEDARTKKIYYVYDQPTHQQAMRALQREQEDITAIQDGIDAAREGRESSLAEFDAYVRKAMHFPTAE